MTISASQTLGMSSPVTPLIISCSSLEQRQRCHARSSEPLGTVKVSKRSKKDQVDLENKVVWIPDSKTPNGVPEVPLTDLAAEAFRDQMQLAGTSSYLFPR